MATTRRKVRTTTSDSAASDLCSERAHTLKPAPAQQPKHELALDAYIEIVVQGGTLYANSPLAPPRHVELSQ